MSEVPGSQTETEHKLKTHNIYITRRTTAMATVIPVDAKKDMHRLSRLPLGSYCMSKVILQDARHQSCLAFRHATNRARSDRARSDQITERSHEIGLHDDRPRHRQFLVPKRLETNSVRFS
jgi:hypothetical protein